MYDDRTIWHGMAWHWHWLTQDRVAEKVSLFDHRNAFFCPPVHQHNAHPSSSRRTLPCEPCLRRAQLVLRRRGKKDQDAAWSGGVWARHTRARSYRSRTVVVHVCLLDAAMPVPSEHGDSTAAKWRRSSSGGRRSKAIRIVRAERNHSEYTHTVKHLGSR